MRVWRVHSRGPGHREEGAVWAGPTPNTPVPLVTAGSALGHPLVPDIWEP